MEFSVLKEFFNQVTDPNHCILVTFLDPHMDADLNFVGKNKAAKNAVPVPNQLFLSGPNPEVMLKI